MKLRKTRPKHFGPLDEKKRVAVASLNDALVRLPALAVPKSRDLYTIETDACDNQIGCLFLLEQKDGSTRFVGYWSGRVMTMIRNWLQGTKSAWLLYQPTRFAPGHERNQLHDPD